MVRFMRAAAGCLLAIGSYANAAEWQPSGQPDPTAILAEARTDTKAGRYDEALEKHMWLYRHATAFDPSFAHARLTDALKAWYQLGRRYPAALNAMERMRAETGAQLLGPRADWRNYQDFSAISRALDGDEVAAVELFEWLDKNKPELARQTYEIARPSLMAMGKRELAGKYMVPVAVSQPVANPGTLTTE